MKLPVSIVVSSLLCRGDRRASTLICNWSCLVHASLLVASTCFLLAILAGCRQTTEPVSYEDLCGLTSEQIGVMGDVEVRQWLEEEYGGARPVILDAMLRERYKDSVVSYGWGAEGRTFVIASLRDGRLFRISFRDIENGPTLGQIVAGLGTPKMISRYVRTYGGHVVYTLGLDYPELGVSVEATGEMTASELSRPGGWAVTLKEDMLIDSVTCYPPHSSIEDVLREVFMVSSGSAMSYQMESRMLWPGFGALVPLDY
jgi:hypothetical protein